MTVLLVILFVALFLCAVILGASRSPKAKGIVNEKTFYAVAICAVVIMAVIIVIGITNFNK